MQKFKFYIIFFLVLSCSEKEIKKGIYLEDILNNWIIENAPPNTDLIFVVPNAGCPGCIEESLIYLRDKRELIKSGIVIFINVRDIKLLEIQVGKELLKEHYVFLEPKQSPLSLKYNKIASFVYIVENRKIVGGNPFEKNYIDSLLLLEN